METRRVTYKLYPSARQLVALDEMCHLHRNLYNAALEERISAWQKHKLSISYVDQCRSLTEIRGDHPEFKNLNAQSAQITLKRLHEAFGHFFRRCREGADEKGFPRFKSKDRFKGFGYKSHGDGFRFWPGEGWKHGKLRLSGIGTMQARGVARTPGQIKGCSITRKVDGWFLSLIVACDPHREIDTDAIDILAMDTGNEKLVTIASNFDDVEYIENDRLWQQAKEDIIEAGRALSKQIVSGKLKRRSRKALQMKAHLAGQHRNLSNRRKERNHQTSARLVRRTRCLVKEQIDVVSMTSTKKTVPDAPWTTEKHKSATSRETLDTSQGRLFSMISYKAEEAGIDLITLDTKSVKPSQRCPVSWRVHKKKLSERTHTLPCGRVIDRDHAATLTMVRAALNQRGREPTWLLDH
jgi:putative transposase